MEEKVLAILIEICGVEDVCEDKDINLFEAGLLDSLGLIELIIKLEKELGIKIEPTELEREEIETPNKLIDYVSMRIK